MEKDKMKTDEVVSWLYSCSVMMSYLYTYMHMYMHILYVVYTVVKM